MFLIYALTLFQLLRSKKIFSRASHHFLIIVKCLHFTVNPHGFSKRLICSDMKITTLPDLLNAVTGKGGLEITFDPETAAKARKCIDEMIRLGG